MNISILMMNKSRSRFNVRIEYPKMKPTPISHIHSYQCSLVHWDNLQVQVPVNVYNTIPISIMISDENPG
jgi:hypothetical protein